MTIILALDDRPWQHEGVSHETGFLVVATPSAPNAFREAVVLIAVHGGEGSLGFVLNHASAHRYADVLAGMGVAVPTGAAPNRPVWRGGRTRPDVAWMLFDARRVEPEDSCRVTPTIGVTASAEAMEAVIAETERHLLILGHLVWEPGALDDEIAAGAWLRTPMDPSLVFEAPPARRWSDATCSALELPTPMWGPARFAFA